MRTLGSEGQHNRATLKVRPSLFARGKAPARLAVIGWFSIFLWSFVDHIQAKTAIKPNGLLVGGRDIFPTSYTS